MRRFTALINPISGGGRAQAAWTPVEARLRATGASVTAHRTRSREHAVELAAAAASRDEVVIAVGGDGLVRDVANGIATCKGTMAIIAAGRGNDLAKLFDMPVNTDAVVSTLLDNPVRRIDLAEVNGVVAPGNVYIGIDSIATQIINNNRWLPASLLYRLAPLRAILNWSAPNYEVTMDDSQTRHIKAHTVVVANSGVYGHGLHIVPTAEMDDGHLDLMIVGDGPRRSIIQFMLQAKTGKHLTRHNVDVYPIEAVTITADRDIPVCVDGDEVTRLPAAIRIRREAIGIIG